MRVFQEHNVGADRIAHGAIVPRHIDPDLRDALMGLRPPIVPLSRGHFDIEHGNGDWTISIEGGNNPTIARDGTHEHISNQAGQVQGVKLTAGGVAVPGITRFRYAGPDGHGFDLRGPLGLYLRVAAGAGGGDLGNMDRLMVRLYNGTDYHSVYLILNGVASYDARLVADTMLYIPLPPTCWTATGDEWTYGTHIPFIEFHVTPTANQTAVFTVGGMTMEHFKKGHIVIGSDGGYTTAMDFLEPICLANQFPLTVFSCTDSQDAGGRRTFAEMRAFGEKCPIEVISHGHSGQLDGASTYDQAAGTVGWAQQKLAIEGFARGANVFSPLGHAGEVTGGEFVNTILTPLGITASRHHSEDASKYFATYGRNYPPKITNGVHLLPDIMQCPSGGWKQLADGGTWAQKLAAELQRVTRIAEHRGCLWTFMHAVKPEASMSSPTDDNNTSLEMMTVVMAKVVQLVAEGKLGVITPTEFVAMTTERPGRWQWDGHDGFAPHLLRRDATGALTRCW